MDKKDFVKTVQYGQRGITTGIVLFILMIAVMINPFSISWLWLVFFIASILSIVMSAVMFSRHKRNYYVYATSIIAIALILVAMAIDYQSEAVKECYRCGFSGGNGFLLDGIDQVLYPYIVVALFLIMTTLAKLSMKEKDARS